MASKSKPKDERQVYWNGEHGTPLLPRNRVISSSDWRRVGVIGNDGKDRDGVTQIIWDASNGFRVPAADLLAFLTEDEFNRFIVNDPDFRVEDGVPAADSEQPEQV